MRRPRMTREVASGLLMIEKMYHAILDGPLGDLFEEALEEAEDAVKSGRMDAVPLLDIEKARHYIQDVNEYYESKNKKDKK
tara:strand:+ start:254 stop:496 length:243 start_codon:yes stop_codon:yes gene_type:complete